MKSVSYAGALRVLMYSLSIWASATAQLPPNATVYRRASASFKGGAKLKILFYEVQWGSAGLIAFRPDGEQVARVSERFPLGLWKGTGVFDIKGDGWPEVVLVGRVGANVMEAIIYDYEGGVLREIGRLQGFEVRLLTLRGHPVIAVRPSNYGSLTDLYAWEDGRFVSASDRFPEFFAGEIKRQEEMLTEPGYPAYQYAQACELAARALVYGRRYADAEGACLKAYRFVRSSAGLIASQIGGGPEVLAADRRAAEEQIGQILEAIKAAKKAGRTELGSVATGPPGSRR